MRLRSLTVKKYRCFEDFTIDFHTDPDGGGMTVLVARNGEGKTAVLDAIDIAWGTFVSSMPEESGSGFKSADTRLVYSDGVMLDSGRPSLRAIFEDDFFQYIDKFGKGKEFVIERELSSSKKRSATTVSKARSLNKLAQYLLDRQLEKEPWPLIAYYRDERLWGSLHKRRRLVDVDYTAFNKGRKFGYEGATVSEPNFKVFFDWFNSLCFIREVERGKRDRRENTFDSEKLALCEAYSEAVKDALKIVLQPTGWNEIDSNGDGEIWAWNSDRREKINIEFLSAGDRIMIAMVADMVFRCCRLNPYLRKNAAKLTPGIVLIDEVELHLYPAWQQRILPFLRKSFPLIQFIVTTHSPQVVSSVPRECVRILNSTEAEVVTEQTQGVESQYALTNVFKVAPEPRDDEFVINLENFASLVALNKADSEEGLRLERLLTEHFGVDYPPLQHILTHKFFISHKECNA